MKTTQRTSLKSLTVLALATGLLAISGCSNLGYRDRNTVSGAAVGAVAGAVLTAGSPVGVVGGAAVGGLIGSEIGMRR